MKSKYKYFCPVESFPNCRACDGGYYSHIKFFNSLKELLEWALKTKDDYAIAEIHRVHNEKFDAFIKYELGQHRCNGIRFELRKMKLRTIDDGKGNLVWRRE